MSVSLASYWRKCRERSCSGIYTETGANETEANETESKLNRLHTACI